MNYRITSMDRLTFLSLRILAVLFVLFVGLLATTGMINGAGARNSCVTCHSDEDDELQKPVHLMKEDVHAAKGLSCVDCHGGDPRAEDDDDAMDPAKGFVGKPSPKEIPDFCGRCHSDAERMKRFSPSLRVDQVKEYATSVHGKKLAEGDQKVATCISCHGSHGIKPNDDPSSTVYPPNVAETCGKCHSDKDYMKEYKIPHDQYAQYKASVHAKTLYVKQDLTAPTCNDCHGNHGATPPRVTSVANVCGQCHVRQAELFTSSTHKDLLDADGSGACAECHSNHDISPTGDHMLGSDERAVCTNCHVEGDEGFRASQAMRSKLDLLSTTIRKAQTLLDSAEHAGMEVSKPKFELTEAHDGLMLARVRVHSFSVAELDTIVKPSLLIANNGLKAGVEAFEEWGYRRKGLAASLFFVVFFAGVIYLKVRQIERKQKITYTQEM